MQIKIMTRFHSTLIQDQQYQLLAKIGVTEGRSLSTTTVVKRFDSKAMYTPTTQDPLLGRYSRKTRGHVHQQTCVRMSTVALLLTWPQNGHDPNIHPHEDG